jgi:shikimate kinase
MNNTEFEKKKFFNLMNVCAVSYRQQMEKDQIGIYWDLLLEYDFYDVEQAFKKHMKTNKFFPAIAEIIEHIPSAQKSRHIGADEAWAIAKTTMNEANTVVTTDQIVAARAIAQPLYSERDETAARMAFRDAYNRIIKTAPENPKWFISPGNDQAQIAGVVIEAIERGRLKKGAEEIYLQAPKTTTMTALTYRSVEKANVEKTNIAQENLMGIHERLGFAKKKTSIEPLTYQEKQLIAEEERQKLEKHRAEIIQPAVLRLVEEKRFGEVTIFGSTIFERCEKELPEFLKNVDDSYKKTG